MEQGEGLGKRSTDRTLQQGSLGGAPTGRQTDRQTHLVLVLQALLFQVEMEQFG